MFSKESPRYRHDDNVDQLRSPNEIVPFLQERLQPRSVVDVGCGLGMFLHCFKQQGVARCLGIDGEWSDGNQLAKYISADEFMIADLEQPLELDRERFDLALCLEVAEHLRAEAADTLVKSLSQLSDIVIFSAAIPFQGGLNHINEEWLDYWQDKFSQVGYVLHDVVRNLIWDNEHIDWWYRQNIVLVTAPERVDVAEAFINHAGSRLSRIVHPSNYLEKTRLLEQILSGRHGMRNYAKLLAKGILNTFGRREG